ncbi:hypothetical protein E4K72_05380 [Oxalobacteraceae bacterium OM1]|nr:hypothetical protein E4K72_05380 [Oxalobacteraceae bacterium OM1]
MLSLLAHALLLSVTFGGHKFGLPDFAFPWIERRLEANNLHITLAPSQPTPLAPASAPSEMPNVGSTSEDKLADVSNETPLVQAPPVLSSPTTSVPAPAPNPAPPSKPVMAAAMRPEVSLPIAPDAPPLRAPAAPDSASDPDTEHKTLERTLGQASPEQDKQNAEMLRKAELIAAAQREAALQEQQRQEAARAEQAARDEVARLEAGRQELARQEARRREVLRQEQARQEEKARQDAIKQEAARQEQAKKEQAQRDRAKQEEEREERLRAIGRQLNEEAAQRDAASTRPARSLLPGESSLRRGWLFGRVDPDADLVLYADAMSRKIERNMTFDMVREVVKQPHVQPTVTVAVRADGSVEKVTFVVSSGVAAIDEAIRKVVASQAPYGAFPPALARRYDVVEIRRTWIFDVSIRLQ